jgi:hypothetical protein
LSTFKAVFQVGLVFARSFIRNKNIIIKNSSNSRRFLLNKLLSFVVGLFVVGAASADMVTISDFTWDGSMEEYGLNSILERNGLTDYTQVDVETFWGQYADCLIIEEVASNEDINSFGWYEVGNIDNTYEIFPGPASNGARVTVALPSSDVGFYLDPANNELNGDAIFYSQSSLNGGIGQVAVFQNNTNQKEFVLAWEDLSMVNGTSSSYGANVSDGDFNDFIVKASVPEPATLGLLGLSLLSLSGLSFFKRKRR